MNEILSLTDLQVKQYGSIGVLVFIGLVIIACGYFAFINARSKKQYENDSLPTLVDVGLEEAVVEEEEKESVSAFDFDESDTEDIDLGDESANSILLEAQKVNERSRSKHSSFNPFLNKKS